MLNTKQQLINVLAICAWLEADQETPLPARQQRDRTIGKTLTATNEASRVEQWWAQLAPVHDRSSALEIAHIRRWLAMTLTLFGSVVGGALASAALTYTGAYPINVLALLGVLVGLPALLLLFSIMGMLFRVFNPNAITATLGLKRWLLAFSERVAQLEFGQLLQGNVAGGRFAYWQAMVYSQWFGIGFFLGILLVFGFMLTFTDLAFGWSTTLSFSPSFVYELFAGFSIPWRTLWPQAVPTQALVEVSQFFRLDQSSSNGLSTNTPAGALGAWWPYVLAVIIFWGLLPRLVLLLVSQLRLRAAISAFLVSDRNVQALLARMSTPLVKHGNDDTDDGKEAAAQGGGTPHEGVNTAPPHERAINSFDELSQAMCLVIWNQAIATQSLPDQISSTRHLDSMLSQADTNQVIDSIDAATDTVVVATKGWEPPLLEFVDLIALFKQRLGPKVPLYIAPVGLNGAEVDPIDWSVWQRVVNEQMGDSVQLLKVKLGIREEGNA